MNIINNHSKSDNLDEMRQFLEKPKLSKLTRKWIQKFNGPFLQILAITDV